MSEVSFCTGEIWCSCCQTTYPDAPSYNAAHPPVNQPGTVNSQSTSQNLIRI